MKNETIKIEFSKIPVQTLVEKSKSAVAVSFYSQTDKKNTYVDQFTGKGIETLFFRGRDGASNELVVSLGKKITLETYRRVAATICDQMRAQKMENVFVDFDAAGAKGLQTADIVQAFVEGARLSSYNFNELKSDKKPSKDFTLHISSKKSGDAGFRAAVNTADVLSECVNFARNLGDLPGNLMTPTILAKRTVEAFKGTKAQVTVWDGARIAKENMNGLLGVSLGSVQDPKFIIIKYQGAAASKQPVVYVGKGLTFDCGGISIKPSSAMEEMKYDMCGGANVIAAVLAMAKLKLKVNVYGLVAASENMPGPNANKPGDIMAARNGKTFEVNNTDAEGRLILADALSYASELKPAVIFDAATLTGAIVVALGNTHTGFFTRNDKLAQKIQKAADETEELVWRMPLTDEHLKDMKGTFADLSNISSTKGAGSATAAAFLEQFVEEGIPWAHFDIAGTAWAVGSRLNYCPKKGASGAMIRTFFELAKQY